MSAGSFRPSGAVPGAFSVRVDDHGETVVMSVVGDVDLITAPELAESISRVLERRPRTVVVDLTEVDFLGSAGMGVLIGGHQEAGDHSRFRVVAAGHATFRPMELIGVADIISIYPTRDQAMAED
jgi:anti-sigma B factor antagonist